MIIVRLLVLLLLWSGAAHATVNEVVAKNNYILADDVTVTFSYTFKILDKANIQVLMNGVTKTVDTDYSVSGVGDSGGGSVTFLTPPGTGSKITLIRKQPVQQLSVYTTNEGFPATRLMTDLDKNIMVDQMQDEQLRRAITLAPNSAWSNITIADPVSGQCLQWNPAATQIVSATCAVGGGGGGGGTSAAKYVLNVPDSSLVNAQALSTLGTGAMLNTTSTGVVSIYTGTSCSNAFPRSLSAALSATCAQVSLVTDVTDVLPPAVGGSGTSTVFTPGSVLFAGASGVYSQDNANFFWDSVNSRLGIGTTSPINRLHIFSALNDAEPTVRVEHSTSTTSGTVIPLRVVSSLSGQMLDTFGTGISLIVRDADAVDNTLAQLTSTRSGADGTGTFAIRTAIAGSLADRILVDAAGAVTISNLASAGTSCVQVNTSGKFSVSGAACGVVALVDAVHGGTNVDSSAATGFAKVTAGTWTFTMTPTVTSLTTTAQGAVAIGPYGASAGNVGELRLLELAANGTNYVAWVAPDSITTSRKIILPAAPGSAGTCLATDGASPVETLSYAACSSGGTGLTSLNGLVGSTQTFTNSTNVKIDSSGTAHVLGWTGTLSAARGGFGVDTSGSTGVPSVLAGVWSVGATLTKALGGTGGSGGTAGQVAYWASTTLTGSSSFLWDNTNSWLAVGAGGTGVATPGVLSFSAAGAPGTSGSAVRLEGTGGPTNSRTVMQIVRSAGTAASGAFAAREDFILRDNGGVDNITARVVAGLSGTIATGTYDIQTAIAGVLGSRLLIDGTGTVNISNTQTGALALSDSLGDPFAVLPGATAPLPARWRLSHGTTAAPQTTRGGVYAIFNKQGVTSTTGCLNRIDPNCGSAFSVLQEKVASSTMQATAGYFAQVNNSTAANQLAGGDGTTLYVDQINNNVNAAGNAIYADSRRNVVAVAQGIFEGLLENNTVTNCAVSSGGANCYGISMYYSDAAHNVSGGVAYRMKSLGAELFGSTGLWNVGYQCDAPGAKDSCFADYSTATAGLALSGVYATAALNLTSATGAGLSISDSAGDRFQLLGGAAPTPSRWQLASGTTAAPQTTRGGALAIFNRQAVTSTTGCLSRIDPNCGSTFTVIQEKTAASTMQGTAAYFAIVNNSTVAGSISGGDVAAVYIDTINNNANAYGTNIFMGSNRTVNTALTTNIEMLLQNSSTADCSVEDVNGSTCVNSLAYYWNSTPSTTRRGGIAYRAQSLDASSGGGLGLHQIGFNCALNGASVACFKDYSGSARSGIELAGSYSSAAINLLAHPTNGKILWASGAYLEGSTPAYVPGSNNTGTIGLIGTQWNAIYANTFGSHGVNGITATKTAGACTFTINGGIITNVTGC